MIIDPATVLRGVAEGSFLAGLTERELFSPEGAGFDLRLGLLSELRGDAHLGVSSRRTAEVSEQEPKEETYRLAPGAYYLGTTVEEVRCPPAVAALVIARSTLYRSGIILSAGLVAPGYSGQLTVGLYNAGEFPCEIEREARFIHVVFLAMTGEGSPYRGQWQGGRVAAPESEEQL
jgi:deoxycytidine triphosphate deaminase